MNNWLDPSFLKLTRLSGSRNARQKKLIQNTGRKADKEGGNLDDLTRIDRFDAYRSIQTQIDRYDSDRWTNMTCVSGRVENVDESTQINRFNTSFLKLTRLARIRSARCRHFKNEEGSSYLFFSHNLTSGESDRLGLLMIQVSSGVLDRLEFLCTNMENKEY